jgi:hypothetical protein
VTAKTSEATNAIQVTPGMLAAMRQGEAGRAWLDEHLELLEPYRGQWVVVHGRQIVAHSPDGREVARLAPASEYPGALLEYVPTREEAAAALMGTPHFQERPPDDSHASTRASGEDRSSR